MSDIFKFAKEHISTKEAVIHYGWRVNHSNLICCPFHNDKHPSMKVDNRFYCFACGAQGDVIDFVSMYFDMGPKEAAEKLLVDFGITEIPKSRDANKERVNTLARYPENKKEMTQMIRKLLECRDVIAQQKKRYEPRSLEEEWSNSFVDAIKKYVQIEYYLDGLMFGPKDESIEFYEFYKEEVEKLVRGIEAGERQNHRKTRRK